MGWATTLQTSYTRGVVFEETGRSGDRAGIPIALCFDVEPDAKVFAPDRPSGWTGFERLLDWAPLLRDRLQTSTGRPAHFGWTLRMDPQIALAYGSASYIAEKYRPQLDDLVAAGDAIGLHTHAWRWRADRRVWIADHRDQAWIDECLEQGVRAYAESLGTTPAFHRFGAQFMSTDTMNRLAQLGITIDLTVEPGEPANRDVHLPGTRWTGRTGDFRRAPRSPYRPRLDDYCRPAPTGSDGLWELPLTSARWEEPRNQGPGMRSRLNHPLRTARGARRRVVTAWGLRRQRWHPASDGADPGVHGHRLLAMWAAWPDPASFWPIAFDAAAELERPYMAFAVRTDVGARPEQLRRFQAILVDEMGKEPRADTVTFSTPQGVLAAMGLLEGTR
jgi:hypothetical protein